MSTPWMPLYIADYLQDTGHLSTVEHGAYLLLIMHYWANRGLPKEDARLARLVRMSEREWAKIRGTISEFFDVDWQHGRIDAELAIADEKRDARAKAGQMGGFAASKSRRKQQQNDSNAAAELYQPQPQSPKVLVSSPEEGLETPPKRARKPRREYPPRFETFWAGYPTDRNMSKHEASQAWARMTDEDQDTAIASLPAFKAFCTKDPTYRVIHANRYLLKRRYEGHIEAAKAISQRTKIRFGTPQWDAWHQHRKAIGESVAFMDSLGRSGGEYEVPTEWPPDHQQEAAA